MAPGPARCAALLLAALCACGGSACRDHRATPAGDAPAPAVPSSREEPTSAPAAAPLPSSTGSTRPARARRAPAREARVDPEPLASAPPSPGELPSAGFRGPVSPGRDAAWIRTLAAAPIAALTYNGGGTSLTFRVRFADGARAVFKPEQTISSSNHRAEIAAYHVDRLLGFGRTAVVVGRRVPRALLEAAVATDDALARRLDAEVATLDLVHGAMIAWHDGPLVDATPPAGWRASLDAVGDADAATRARLAAWVDMLVFDALIDNTDRWSGGNVLSIGKGGPLVFLDNASAFLPSRARITTLPPSVTQLCHFPVGTIEALRGGDRLSARLASSLARDPSGVTLDPAVLGALDRRRQLLVQQMDACETRTTAAAMRIPP